MDHPQAPTAAEQARTALATARAASLTMGGTTTVVKLESLDDGRPVALLLEGSAARVQAQRADLATLAVAGPQGFHALHLTGPLTAGEPRADGLVPHVLSPVSARLVGPRPVVLNLGQLYSFAPDPIAAQAAAFLDHLTQAHSGALLSCLRAHGLTEVEAVVPVRIDRYGIELGLVDAEGVRLLRLTFPGGPVETLSQVASHLRVALTCRCARCADQFRTL